MWSGGEGGFGIFRQNEVADLACGMHIRGAEVFPQPPFGEVRQVKGAVQPPGAVVVPQVMIEAARFLSAGDDVWVHGDVGFMDLPTSRASEMKTPEPKDIGAGVGMIR